ncbi:hypothetical protein GLAREA_02257 [Glarea lozoyensis ATCC 20868]|uniref:Uncharacterized protein n=1 Tax=Glarea lozoyensis (strain ATCC 20868 / MF5171) TaxID=1116229 RepID=S3CKS3_GLAL2|nr:uncharacterized protein GLAREA_02257 [Glarea lozoyensis ATCC 20868]EPE26345.1 hypothetical protein GLAREA_02257 [Glarea lozoyensis ATCC 20868]
MAAFPIQKASEPPATVQKHSPSYPSITFSNTLDTDSSLSPPWDNQSITTSSVQGKTSYPKLSFITISHPENSKTTWRRKAVRSHAAANSHGNFRNDPENSSSSASPGRESSRRKRRSSRQSDVSFPLELKSEDSQESQLSLDSRRSSISNFGGTGDPFDIFPVPAEPYLPFLVDHYMHGMRNIPDLEQERNYDTLRNVWFPLALEDPAAFQVVILFSARHQASVASSPNMVPNQLVLKQKAITAINEGIRDINRSSKDALIGAVAKMAFYESMFGDLEAFDVHMLGLKRMIDMRGGLLSLGSTGFLARMILWIDIRASEIHRRSRCFKESLTADGGNIIKMEETDRTSLIVQ